MSDTKLLIWVLIIGFTVNVIMKVVIILMNQQIISSQKDIYKAICNPVIHTYGVSKEPKMKGCPACFGSGGKRTSPCKHCDGTGKVQA